MTRALALLLALAAEPFGVALTAAFLFLAGLTLGVFMCTGGCTI